MYIEVNLMHTVNLTPEDLLDLVIAQQGLVDVDRSRSRVRPKHEGQTSQYKGKTLRAFSGLEVVIVSKHDQPDEPKTEQPDEPKKPHRRLSEMG